MKKLLIILSLIFVFQLNATAQDIIELDASQSMSISGKGTGQDAAINPFLEQGSVAIVKNLGEHHFSIRIQYRGEIKKQQRLDPSRITRVLLPKGYEMYFDAKEKKTKAEVSFRALQ